MTSAGGEWSNFELPEKKFGDARELRKLTGNNRKFIVLANKEAVSKVIGSIFNVAPGNSRWSSEYTTVEFVEPCYETHHLPGISLHAMNPAYARETVRHYEKISKKRLHREEHCRVYTLEKLSELVVTFRGVEVASKIGVL